MTFAVNDLYSSPASSIPSEGQTVDVWLIELQDCPRPNHYLETLSPEERARAAAFRFDHHRQRWITSHYALRTILSRYVSIPALQLCFTVNDHGKPYLSGSSNALQFNLSHTHSLAVIAVARLPLGVDVEQIDREVDHLALSQRFFAKSEFEVLAAVQSSNRARTFFEIWTRKEAYLKARGLGLAMPLSAFSVNTVDGAPVSVQKEWTDGLSWHCHGIDAGSKFVVNVVSQYPNPDWRLLRWKDFA